GQAPTIAVIATGAASYQWFIGSPGVENSPIVGGTGPVLSTLVVNTVGTTSVWVKVSNSCGSINSNAAIITVNCGATKPVITAPLARNLSDYSFAQLPCAAPPCLITQIINLDGLSALGKTGINSTDSFSISSDKPWITVSPSSGNLPPAGADVTVTIDASQLDVGSSQATLTMNRTQGAAKVGTLESPPPKNVPVNVSLVAPVTPKPKDGNAQLNAL